MENFKYGIIIVILLVCFDKLWCLNNFKLDKNWYCYLFDLICKFFFFMNDIVEKIKSVEYIEIVNVNLLRGILFIKENVNCVLDRLRKYVLDIFI